MPAALTNHTVSTYVAQNYTSGHAAWLYLHKTFALPSLTQASLRDSLSKLAFSPTGDPRLQTMLFQKIARRIDPPIGETEKAELLLKKIPLEYSDVATNIEAMQELRGERPGLTSGAHDLRTTDTRPRKTPSPSTLALVSRRGTVIPADQFR